MYNINFDNSTDSATYKRVYMYINLSSIVGDPTLISGGGTGGKYIWMQFRGRKTNYQRIIQADPDSGFGSNPQYIHNDRYWKISFGVYYPLAKFIEGGAENKDILSTKLFGYVVLPADETYDIYFYYSYNASIQPYDTKGDLISGVNPLGKLAVLNVNQSASLVYDGAGDGWEVQEPDSTQPNVLYRSFENNDLSFQYMSSKGKPRNNTAVANYQLSGDLDNRDAQYGVQTWTPDYND
tara:strand:+ start:51 stop:764 length:714 start_codon:yes stop_codon:yes gene_type:complete